MADQHEATSFIVVLEIVIPRVLDVVVLNAAYERSTSAGKPCPKSRQRDLPIQRSIGAALRGEACKLLTDDVEFRRIRRHVAVGGRICRSRGLNVEAVDWRVRIRLPCLSTQFPISRNNSRGQVDVTCIVPSRPAEPGLGIAVIIRRRCLTECVLDQAGKHNYGHNRSSSVFFHKCCRSQPTSSDRVYHAILRTPPQTLERSGPRNR